MEWTGLQERRAIEDRAVELGQQRQAIRSQLRENTRAITELVGQAISAGIGLAPLARLLEVSRQTLYHWHDIAKEQGE